MFWIFSCVKFLCFESAKEYVIKKDFVRQLIMFNKRLLTVIALNELNSFFFKQIFVNDFQ